MRITIGIFLLTWISNFATSEPDVESVAIANSKISEEIIGSTQFDGWNWSLVKTIDGESGGIYILKNRNGQSETVGGDSFPFPLSRYSIPNLVVKRLAEIYVDYEIQSTPGGLSSVKHRVSQYNKIPHDLKDAYSKYMEVNALPLYIAENLDSKDMIRLLNEATEIPDSEEFQKFDNRKLKPAISHIIIQVATKPNAELSDALLKAIVAHPYNYGLQEAIAVNAGRNQELFIRSWEKLNATAKPRVIQSLHSALRKNLIGGAVKKSVKEFILQISGE